MEWYLIAAIIFGGIVLLLIGWLTLRQARQKMILVRRAEEWLHLGKTPEQAADELVAEFPFVTPEQAAPMIEQARKRLLVDRALEWLRAGEEEEAVQVKLEAEGLPAPAAQEVLAAAGFTRFCVDHPMLSMTLGILLPLLGIAGVVGGVLLWIGNRSGRFKTFPFSGQLAMLVGLMLFGLGSKLFSRVWKR